MENSADKFDVLRNIISQLKELTPEEQGRVVKWACEELGIGMSSNFNPTNASGIPVTYSTDESSGGSVDIKTFVAEKDPKTDIHFAVVVAYFYRFLAKERKETVTSDDIQEATRLAKRSRLINPTKTTNNAVSSGLLDSAGRGLYKINTVGENLVAIVLPGSSMAGTSVRKKNSLKASVKAKTLPRKRR